LERELLRPSLGGEQIKRYQPYTADQYILYTTRDTEIAKFPHCMAHLSNFRRLNTCKEVEQKKHPWWSLHRPRAPIIFSSPKLIGLTTTRRIELIYDEKDGLYVTDAMYVFAPAKHVDPKALMGVMQSKIFGFLYGAANMGEARIIPQIKASKLLSLPIPRMTKCGKLTKTVDSMLALHKQLTVANSEAQKQIIQRLIEATDAEIDRMVYDLYELTPEEVVLVEDSTRATT
jgi:hypothetical protein